MQITAVRSVTINPSELDSSLPYWLRRTVLGFFIHAKQLMQCRLKFPLEKIPCLQWPIVLLIQLLPCENIPFILHAFSSALQTEAFLFVSFKAAGWEHCPSLWQSACICTITALHKQLQAPRETRSWDSARGEPWQHNNARPWKSAAGFGRAHRVLVPLKWNLRNAQETRRSFQ